MVTVTNPGKLNRVLCFILFLQAHDLMFSKFYVSIIFICGQRLADIVVRISVRPDVCSCTHFDHFPEVRFQRNCSRICIFEKVTSGHRFRCRPKSGSTGAGDKLVILVHFFAQNLSPPTVLIGEC